MWVFYIHHVVYYRKSLHHVTPNWVLCDLQTAFCVQVFFSATCIWSVPSFFKSLYWQSVTKLQLGQVLSCWSNVSRLRFDQHGSQLTNFGHWVALTLTKVWLTFDQDMTSCHGQIFPKCGRSIDYPSTEIRQSILGQCFQCRRVSCYLLVLYSCSDGWQAFPAISNSK